MSETEEGGAGCTCWHRSTTSPTTVSGSSAPARQLAEVGEALRLHGAAHDVEHLGRQLEGGRLKPEVAACSPEDTPTRIISSNNESGDGATAGLQLVAAAPVRSRGAPHRA